MECKITSDTFVNLKALIGDRCPQCKLRLSSTCEILKTLELIEIKGDNVVVKLKCEKRKFIVVLSE